MKLWLISQTVNNDYDTYDSAVVAAKTEEEAQRMHPLGGRDITDRAQDNPYQRDGDDGWVRDPGAVFVAYLGEAKKGTKQGVICASYNAG